MHSDDEDAIFGETFSSFFGAGDAAGGDGPAMSSDELDKSSREMEKFLKEPEIMRCVSIVTVDSGPGIVDAMQSAAKEALNKSGIDTRKEALKFIQALFSDKP